MANKVVSCRLQQSAYEIDFGRVMSSWQMYLYLGPNYPSQPSRVCVVSSRVKLKKTEGMMPKNDLIMNSSGTMDAVADYEVQFPLRAAPLTSNLCWQANCLIVSLRQNFKTEKKGGLEYSSVCMQKIHTPALQLFQAFDGCQKGSVSYKRISRIWSFVPSRSANLKVKVQTALCAYGPYKLHFLIDPLKNSLSQLSEFHFLLFGDEREQRN